MKTKKFLMDASSDLHLKNKQYVKQLKQYVWQAYLNDYDDEDITTFTFLGWYNPVVQAEIIAKEAGVISGMMEAYWFLKRLKIKVLKYKKEGGSIKKGDVVMVLKGRTQTILRAERTLLNLLQRSSGIATETAKMKDKMPKSIQLLATRKTFWGDLDKRAVAVGGGGTHRLNLGDAILIKENHIAMTRHLEKSLKKSFKKARKVRFVELEVETLDQVRWLTDFMKVNTPPQNFVVMLDNFTPINIKKAIKLLKSFKILIEASGGIHLTNVKKYCIKGLSAISSGSVINKAKALDLSLRFTSEKL